ncbi:unnamed protein product [Anisakis simplex]|uniref:LRRCT domain-containing protein n=1 Tax=Anisakis simplex TaxID=6269 RepID=A0A0M3JQV6_ANISI|nr:unnamed protein product [Anisakis simplex]
MNDTTIIFNPSSECSSNLQCRCLTISAYQWSLIRTFDVSSQQLAIDESLFKMLANVWSINLSSTKLPLSFSKWLTTTTSIRHLNLSSAILTISKWEWCAENLEWLDISKMSLRYLAISSNCKLRYLNANNNVLESVFLASTTLEIVLLEHNRLKSWPVPPTGIALTRLHTLSLTNNQIDYLPDGALVHYPQLQNLDISRNILCNLSVASFPSIGMQIRSLNVSHNRLATFVHPVLPSLLLLDLSHNSLVSLDSDLLAGLPLLQHFYLNSNVEIFSQCHQTCWLNALIQMLNLVELNLSNCQLSRVPDLSPFEALRRLDLSRNKLTTIDGYILPKGLQRLDVSQNHIHTLTNFSVEKLTSLQELDISRNPLLCECTLAELIPLFDAQKLNNADLYYCFSGSWQYPLRSYIDNVHSCIHSTSQLLTVLLNAIFILMITFTMFIFITFLLCRYRIHQTIFIPFKYTPLTMSDANAVDL